MVEQGSLGVLAKFKDLKWWQATVMIVSILLAAGFASYYGANVSVNVQLDARVAELEDFLRVTINSTFYTTQKEHAFIVSPVVSGATTYYCMQNGTDGFLKYYNTNKTLVEQFALGNSSSGTVFLKGLQHNTSLTVPANVMVIEQYQNKLRYYNGQFSAGFVTGTTAPSNPEMGQWWYDTTAYTLKIWNGTDWAASSGTQGSQGEAGTVGGLPFSYMVFANATSNYRVNGTTGAIDYSSTSAGNSINFALGNLTSGRTWKEKVVPKGHFTIDKQILIRNYTILDLTQAYFTLSASLNLGSNGETGNGGVHGIIYNTDVPARDIDIIGGTIGENANSHNSIRLENVTKANIYGVTCYDHIHLDNVSDSFIQYCTLKPLANIVPHKSPMNCTIQYNNIENGQIYIHWINYRSTWGVPADNNKILYNRVFTSTRNDTSMMLFDYCYNTMIQGNQIFVNGAGIYLYMAHNSTIIDNYIKDLYMNSTQHGIDSAFTNYQDRSGNIIVGFAIGFTFDSSGSATVARNRFLDCDIGIGSYTPPSYRRFEVTGNLFFNCGMGLELKGYYANVIGNTFQNCSTGIWIGSVGQGNLIDGNTFTWCTSPIYMRNQCIDNQIINNGFFNNTEAAIQFWAGGSNNTIRGNTIKYNLGDGIDFHGGDGIDQNENIIEDNVIEYNGDASGEYGIDLYAYCDNNIIKNNYLRGNYAGQIRIVNNNCAGNIIEYNNITGTLTNSGTSTIIRYNRGYVTECSNAAVNGTATTFTITHGLAATPVIVFCSFNTSGFTYSWTVTSSTITVTLSDPSADATQIICYYEARTWNYS